MTLSFIIWHLVKNTNSFRDVEGIHQSLLQCEIDSRRDERSQRGGLTVWLLAFRIKQMSKPSAEWPVKWKGEIRSKWNHFHVQWLFNSYQIIAGVFGSQHIPNDLDDHIKMSHSTQVLSCYRPPLGMKQTRSEGEKRGAWFYQEHFGTLKNRHRDKRYMQF